MTNRLYYDDSYLKEFSASVLSCAQQGDQYAVTLDRTAFYPNSGGQPHDTGFLGETSVVDVEETSEGEILHFLNTPLPMGPLIARIDWQRRFDHMQQHTGQHILSQAFVQAAGAATLSFHLGQEASTIDVDLPEPTLTVIQNVERLANQILFQNRTVQILNVDRSKLKDIGIRKESQREGEIRVIDVEGFDRSACGGTHVQCTGEIGLVFLSSYERYKGGTRVEFVCGGRALQAFRKQYEILSKLSLLFSSDSASLPGLVEKTIQERSALARENIHLQDAVHEMEAKDLLAGAQEFNGVKFVKRIYTDRNLDSAKILAQKITASAKAVAILGIQNNPAQIALTKNKDVPGDCNQAIKSITARFGGKGGGRPDVAQAGGINNLEETLEEIEKIFRNS